MIRPLISFGGWMTVTNIISPVMVYLDRFLIGAVLTMTAVSFYATPYEVVSRLLIIPDALMGVMFPAFSAAFVCDRTRATHLYARVIKYVFLLQTSNSKLETTIVYNTALFADINGNLILKCSQLKY